MSKEQLADSLAAVAQSMRHCAQIAEQYAKSMADSDAIIQRVHPNHVSSDDHHPRRKTAPSPDDNPDASKKRKRNTKPKDPNAPKRPASSYILFQNEVRKELKERHPTLSNSDLLGLISEQWKNMTDDQKETYNQAMKTAKAQYSEEKKAYDNRTPEEIEAANVATAAAASLKKANAKPRGPKPAGTAAAASTPQTAVKARPPPPPEEHTTESSDDSESDEDDDKPESPIAPKPAPVKTNGKHLKDVSSSDSSEEEEEEEEEEVPEPPKKKSRGGSAKPAPAAHKEKEKSKKGSKA